MLQRRSPLVSTGCNSYPASRGSARDEGKTRPQLLAELRALRRQIAALAEEREAHARREQQRRTQQEYFRDVALHSADLLIELGAHGRILYVSPTCVDLLGRAPEELAGRSVVDPMVLESVHPEDRIRMFEDFPRLLSGEGPGVAAFRWVHRDGRVHRLEAKANPFRTPSGELRAVVAFRDITTSERIRLERVRVSRRRRSRR